MLAPILDIWRTPSPKGHPCSQRDTLGDKDCPHRPWWGLSPSSSSLCMEGDKDGQTDRGLDRPQQRVISILPSSDP